MKKVYICSPYKAADKMQLERNIKYARELTRQALEAGYAPVTPHLYMPQCINEDKPGERKVSMSAGLALLECCNFVIAGIKYGISEGMSAEIKAADAAGIEVVNADKLLFKTEHERNQYLNEYARYHACDFCQGSRMHTCTGYKCQGPYKKAYKYAKEHYSGG